MALQQAIIGTSSGKVGSIGAAWPPAFDGNNQRIKGFCPSVIRSRASLESEAFAYANQARREHPQATRTTFRAFVNKGLAEGITRLNGSLEFSVEARVPADSVMPGFDIVYFGKNDMVRTPDENIRKKEKENVEAIRQEVSRVVPHIAMARLAANGYEISMPINGNVHNELDVKTMLNLYREAYQHYTFPINETTIQVMMGNGNRVVIARDAEGQIAAALIAEECEIRLGNGQMVRLYELSDFATFRKDRGNGLMTALQIEAVRLIRRLPGGKNAIIYAEDSAPWKAVNKSSQQAGLDFGGTLPWHCSLLSDRDVQYEGKYASLNVWYV